MSGALLSSGYENENKRDNEVVRPKDDPLSSGVSRQTPSQRAMTCPGQIVKMDYMTSF